jgi:hypothetical protein
VAKSDFKKIRAIDDRTLNFALSNHQITLQNVVAWIQAYGREHMYLRLWAAAVTGAVIYLALR